MTEKEKMLAGELYNAQDKELVDGRIFCRQQMSLYNSENCTVAERYEIIRSLFGSCGEKAFIEPQFRCDYGYNIYLGENFYGNFNCVFLDVNTITIGRDALLGPNIQLYTATHPVDPKIRKSGLELGYPITVGDNVWIGGGTIVCPGVSIGDNAVIGAGSVVTKDIPANMVAVGNPCVPIRPVNNNTNIV